MAHDSQHVLYNSVEHCGGIRHDGQSGTSGELDCDKAAGTVGGNSQYKAVDGCAMRDEKTTIVQGDKGGGRRRGKGWEMTDPSCCGKRTEGLELGGPVEGGADGHCGGGGIGDGRGMRMSGNTW